MQDSWIMTMQTVSQNKAHGGIQGVYKHLSRETKTDMTFSSLCPRTRMARRCRWSGICPA